MTHRWQGRINLTIFHNGPKKQLKRHNVFTNGMPILLSMLSRPLVGQDLVEIGRGSVTSRAVLYGLMVLRPPYPINKAYQLPPVQCCFIAIICVCIKLSQTHGPIIRMVPSALPV